MSLDIATDRLHLDGDPLNRDRASSTVVIIDDRQFVAECLVAGLRVFDSSTRFLHVPSVQQWTGGAPSDGSSLMESPSLVDGPSLVVLSLSSKDLADPLCHKVESLKALDLRAEDIPFLILGEEDGPDHVFKALRWGARGYVPMSTALKVVVEVLHLVRAGGTFVPASSLERVVVRDKPLAVGAKPAAVTFSPRQMLVSRGLLKGKPNKIIAHELNMSESTVKVHVRHIMRKLNANNRTHAAFLINQTMPD